VIGLLVSLAAAYGAFLLYTSLALGWTGVGFGPKAPRLSVGLRRRAGERLAQAGLSGTRPRDAAAVMGGLFVVGSALAFALFGGLAPALVAGAFAASFPAASYRARRDRGRSRAREAWPRLIEELRLHTGSLGRSIPQALFEVGRRAPAEMQPAFAAAEREWLISTDFARTAAVLKDRLADPAADAALETLLVAHEVGGSDLDRRLAALVEDRVQDLEGRKDARAKQAGVRFARRFVLVVPLGMALAGLSIGAGRSAYQTAGGQLAVVLGLASVAACWAWAGRLMRLPEEDRVLR
jgi:tight adherence protein B